MTDNNTIVVRVNGEPRRVPPDTCLGALLDAWGLDRDHVVVELDGEIVAPADLDTRRVQAAARLEIVHFVGGG